MEPIGKATAEACQIGMCQGEVQNIDGAEVIEAKARKLTGVADAVDIRHHVAMGRVGEASDEAGQVGVSRGEIEHFDAAEAVQLESRDLPETGGSVVARHYIAVGPIDESTLEALQIRVRQCEVQDIDGAEVLEVKAHDVAEVVQGMNARHQVAICAVGEAAGESARVAGVRRREVQRIEGREIQQAEAGDLAVAAWECETVDPIAEAPDEAG